MVYPAFADEQTVNVPFVPDQETQCTYTSFENKILFTCQWGMILTDEEIVIIAESDPELIPEKIVDDAIERIRVMESTSTSTEPLIRTEQYEKIQGIMDAKAIVESYGKGELDVQKFCFGGDVKEGTIQEEHETIDVARPYDNQPLKTNQELKYKQLMSNICEAEYKLKYKVHNWLRTMPGEGEQYVFVPRDSFDGIDLWAESTGLDNPTYAYEDAKQVELYRQSEQIRADQFQCSISGKAQGHCIYPDVEPFVPDPESFISNEGKAIKSAWKAYLQTGVTEIPKRAADEEFKPTIALDQYIAAYGITQEELKEWYESRNP